MSDFWTGPFVYFHSSCKRTAKALVRLHGCTDSPESSLVAYVIITISHELAQMFIMVHIMIWAPLYSYYKFLACRSYKPIPLSLYDAVMLCYVHYIMIGHLYYKHAYGRVLEVCKQKKHCFGNSK